MKLTIPKQTAGFALVWMLIAGAATLAAPPGAKFGDPGSQGKEGEAMEQNGDDDE